jgi:hypothetical protein
MRSLSEFGSARPYAAKKNLKKEKAEPLRALMAIPTPGKFSNIGVPRPTDLDQKLFRIATTA